MAVHRANLFFQDKVALLKMYDLAWSCAGVRERYSLLNPPVDKDRNKEYTSAHTMFLGRAFYTRAAAEIAHRGYAVLRNFADPMRIVRGTDSAWSGLPDVL